MQPTSKKPTYHLYTMRIETYLHTAITGILTRFPRLSHEAIAQRTGIPIGLIKNWVEIHE